MVNRNSQSSLAGSPAIGIFNNIYRLGGGLGGFGRAEGLGVGLGRAGGYLYDEKAMTGFNMGINQPTLQLQQLQQHQYHLKPKSNE